VAGLDEARARSVLADMQERLARGPNVALGITASSTAEDARAAFLQLTKQYHPVRFGRMATDIQKQANEVFLALRAAHDSAAKALRRAAGTSPSQPLPAVPPPSAPGASRPGQALPSRPPSAANRAGAMSPASRPPGVIRPVGSAPVTAQDEAVVLDLLQRAQWDQARSALHQLSARDPASRRIRALVCYARGREAQLDRRLDDARVELQDALDLDPDLQVAKTALTELFTRRK